MALVLAGVAGTAPRAAAQPGAIDPGFAVPGLRTATSLGTTPEGRVLVAGVFTNAPAGAAIVILSEEGTVQWRSEPLATSPQAMVAGPLGEVVVGGINRVSRFWPPATAPDGGFVTGNGWRSMNPGALAMQPDGNLLIAGSGVGGAQMDWMTERGLRTLPLRIDALGARDVAFGAKVGTGPCTDLAVGPDGAFLAARTTIQRFLADGTPDGSFTPWTAANVELLRRLPSGDYLVGGGAFTSFNGAPARSLIRVGPTGARVPGFEFAGKFDALYDAAGTHRPLAVLPDERLLVGQAGGGVQRFLANGALDPSWTDPAPAAVVKEVVVDSRGRAYVLGPLEGPLSSKPLYRLSGDSEGPVDVPPAFAQQPPSSVAVPAGGTVTLSAAVTGRPEPSLQWWFDGAALAGETGPTLTLSGFDASRAGAYQLVASNRVAVVRSDVAVVLLDRGAARPGSRDVAFETPPLNPPAGVAGFVPTTTNPLFWDGAAAADGGLYLWGNFVFRHADGHQQLGVVRLDPEGTAQASFRTGETVRDAGGGLVQADGRVVLGAVFVVDGAFRNGLVRLDENGTIDPSFAAGNLFEGVVQAGARQVLRDAQGGYLVGGGFPRVGGVTRYGLCRLKPDGTLDPAFPALPVSSRVACMALAPDGDLYLGGSFSLPGATVAASLIRLNADGSVDGGFAPVVTVGGVVGLEALPAGGVAGLTAGIAQTAPQPLASLFRLRTDGTVDPSFESGFPNRIGSALLRLGDGRFLVAGDPASAPGAPSVARHLAGGVLDAAYTNAPSVASVRSLRPAAGGRTWVITAALPGAVRLHGDDYVPPVPPVLVRAPRSISASGLTVASFRVVADGVPPLRYQWRFNGKPLDGQTADVLNVAPLSPDKLGDYDVVVTDGGGASTTSPAARLSNEFPPSILVQPLERTNVLEGATVTLSVVADGTAPLAYQWRRNGVDLPGETGTSLVLADLVVAQAGGYSVEVRNVAGSVVSRATDVKVEPRPVPPSIVREPEDRVFLAGISQFCLEPGVAGSGPLGFQWQKNGEDLPGATRNSLCLGPLPAGDGGRYRLVVTNAQGRAETREAVITVVEPVFEITDSPKPVNLVPDGAAIFTAKVRNDAGRPLTYRWQRNGVDLPGATNEVLRLDPATEAEVGARFRVVVSDGVSTRISDEAVTTGRPEVVACPGGADSLFRLRGNPLPLTLGVEARGFGALTYQWRRGPVQVGQVSPLAEFVPVPGATGPTLVLPALVDAEVGDYFCEVRSPYGTSAVDPVSQVGAMRVRLVDPDSRPGRVDFGWDYLALGQVYALNGVEFLGDGRVYVTGAFGNPFVDCAPLRLLARLNADGTLDPTFAPVPAAFGTSVGLVRQPSGKVVIAGDFRGIPGLPDPGPGRSVRWARFHPDGTLDPSFQTAEPGFDGSGGIQMVGQSDGRILVTRQGVVYRLMPDGARDPGFGAPINGPYSPGIDSIAAIRRMIVDGQDRIYLLNEHAVRRFLPDGQPDPAWTVMAAPENLVRMAVGVDGSVVATGYPPAGDPDGLPLQVVRFDADGSRTPGFNAVYPAGGTIAGAPALLPDGKIVVGGTAGTLSGRLLSDGTRDAAWEAMASPGGATSPSYDPYWFVAPDGRILVAAHAFDDGIGFATLGERRLFRLHTGGNALGQVRLATPRFVDGRFEFQIPTEPGRTYQVQFLGNLAGAGGATMGWATQQTVVGDGTAKSVSLGTPGSAGFYRVMVAP